MSILTKIVKTIKGHNCGMFIRRTENEITLSGANFGLADLKINLASFSNKPI
jgi:hypothetical protein